MTELEASRLVVHAIRRIDRTTADAEIDGHADQLERRLAGTAFAHCHWVRELLFRYRGVQLGVGDDHARFITLIARASRRRMLDPRAAHILDQLVIASRGAVVAGASKRG